MKVTITSGCVAAGKPQKKGATVDVDAAEARLLIGLGKAKAAKADSKDADEK